MIRNMLVAMGFLCSISLYAQECSQVLSELQVMRKAQNTIQMSLVANHEMFATSMESYSQSLSETAGRVYKVVSDNMASNAQSFRDRGFKAQKTAQKLDLATQSLIQKVSKCLK